MGLYTGTRHAAICGAAFHEAIGRGHIDLERGVFFRRAKGAAQTKKRQPAVRLPDRLLAHLRRWHRLGIATHAVVEWNGRPVSSVRKGFAAAVKAAGLPVTGPDMITPHTLRHTAATWMMQNGADLWQAAGYLGMTVETLQERYGHHHPNYQADAARAVSASPGQDRDRNAVNKKGRTSSVATKINAFKGRPVRRNVRDEGVAGSNPATPTKHHQRLSSISALRKWPRPPKRRLYLNN